MKFSGYASVTDTPYDMGWYTESIKRGAFAKTLAEKPDVQLLVNHGGLPLARTLSGTMSLSEDRTGLLVDADLDGEDPDVLGLARKMKRGDIDQMSFAFRTTRQEWNEDYTDRQITECNIHRGDVSVVNQGANPATSASVRSLRSTILAAGGRATQPQRKELAGALGTAVICEVRSFALDGHTYRLRSASTDSCNRCEGEGTITLKGRAVSCPLCGGTGGAESNGNGDGEPDAPDLGTPSDGRSALALKFSRDRLRLARIRQPPR